VLCSDILILEVSDLTVDFILPYNPISHASKQIIVAVYSAESKCARKITPKLLQKNLATYTMISSI